MDESGKYGTFFFFFLFKVDLPAKYLASRS